MKLLTRDDLLSLEEYAQQRDEFRQKVLRHKQNRRIQVGPAAHFYFEDRLTIHYQIQEILRIEKTFEVAGIEDELEAYNPLIPNGSNWKATFMLEYPEVEQRRQMLEKLVDIENYVWASTEGHPKVFAIADEDLDRSTDQKTSAVHFLRFELPAAFIQAVKANATVAIGINHDNYNHTVEKISDSVRLSLLQDLD